MKVVNNAIQHCSMNTRFNTEYQMTYMANNNKLNTLSTWAYFIYTTQNFWIYCPFTLYAALLHFMTCKVKNVDTSVSSMSELNLEYIYNDFILM